MTVLDFTIKTNCSTYITSTVNKQRASCTSSAQVAADRLGEKVFGPAFRSAHKVRKLHGCELWKIVGDDKAIAWCWQSGRIDIGKAVPEGAIAFAKGPRRALQQLLDVLARHGQGASNGLLLVPGVPEADSPDAAVDALIAWTEWCAKRNGKPDAHGVRFARNGEELQ